jgi:hypothetical protein
MRPFIASLFASTVLVLAGVLVTEPAAAQQGGQLKLPPAAIKPYKVVAITLAKPMNDPSLDALRKQLADIAQKKDRAGLAKLVVAQGFFWLQDKDLADKKKSSIDNLAKAIGLDAKDGSGWDMINAYAADPTAMPIPDHKGVMCAPADPTFDPKEFDALTKSTLTTPGDWGYIAKDGTDVRSAAQANAPSIEKVGLSLVRVLPETGPPANAAAAAFVHIATPSGKSGFVAAEAIAPIGGDAMCYLKDASGWKITGYIGGNDQ